MRETERNKQKVRDGWKERQKRDRMRQTGLEAGQAEKKDEDRKRQKRGKTRQ